MSEYNLKQERLPPASVFLNTVCPGLSFLDENTFFSVESLVDSGRTLSIQQYNWPLTGLVTSPTVSATLEDSYLNIARPPYQREERKNVESTTYVPLPLHITSLFAQVIHETTDQNNNNNRHLHIGAGVNPLVHDPFRLVLLNPGCLSSMVRLPTVVKPQANGSGSGGGVREPLNKMATSINQLLRIGTPEQADWSPYFQSLVGHVDPELASPKKAQKDTPFSHFLDFNQKHYKSQIASPSVPKLLVSANVNVLNVFALNESFDYNNTASFSTTSTLFPQPQPQTQSQQQSQQQQQHSQTNNNAPASSTASVISSSSQVTAYTKVIEKPILRLQFKSSVIVTSLFTINSEPSVVLGLNTGEIIYINLSNLTFRHFTDLGTNARNLESTFISISDPVTSLNAIIHPTRNLLLVAGFASGEVVIIDPTLPASSSPTPYKKTVVGKDRFLTYFKKFDLSLGASKDASMGSSIGPPYIVGHFKVSHKPITSIASTIAHDVRTHLPNNPMILALASDDGLVRFIDLIATHGQNYGDPSNFYNLLILTDMISSYFQDGVRFIEFSPDFRFIVVCGKGDSIEIFRMSYYNVNGLLLKNSEATKKSMRSRSNTVNSNSSNAHSLSLFLPPISSNTSQTLDMQREDSHEHKYPPIIKDIVIVSRFKAHTNTVERVAFVKNDEFHQTKSKAGHDVYNFISCGRDGHVMVWELNTKALTKTKKTHMITSHRSQSIVSEKRTERNPSMASENNGGTHSSNTRGLSLGLPSAKKSHHQRNRSITSHDDNPLTQSFSALGISNILSSNTPPPSTNDNSEEQLNIVNSLYRSLYELRLKKHYGKQEIKRKYQCIIHGIVDDKELPIMRIPLLTMNLSCLIKEGSISGFHLASNDFWIFGSTGDIFRYKIN